MSIDRRAAAKWCGFIAANALVWLAVWSVSPTRAQPRPAGKQPFTNSVTQRNDMLRELREIKTLLKEQNSLLRKQLAQTK